MQKPIARFLALAALAACGPTPDATTTTDTSSTTSSTADATTPTSSPPTTTGTTGAIDTTTSGPACPSTSHCADGCPADITTDCAAAETLCLAWGLPAEGCASFRERCEMVESDDIEICAALARFADRAGLCDDSMQETFAEECACLLACSSSDDRPFFPAPVGCATIVEVLGRTGIAERHITIDASACPRGARLALTMHAGVDGPWLTDLGEQAGCAVYGGPASVASFDPSGVVVTIDGPADNPLQYSIVLTVDDMVSDTIKMPELMTGAWEGQPDAPTMPVRRAMDWSWDEELAHVNGCTLNDG